MTSELWQSRTTLTFMTKGGGEDVAAEGVSLEGLAALVLLVQQGGGAAQLCHLLLQQHLVLEMLLDHQLATNVLIIDVLYVQLPADM